MPTLRAVGAVAAALAAALAALLPTLLTAMLKHMFTAPHSEPWQAGSLRLHNVTNLPTQVLNAEERIVALSSDSHRFKARDDDVWVTSYVKSGTTWTIAILAALWDHPAQEYAGHLQRTTRTFCPQPELPDLGWGDDGFGHSLEELGGWTLESELRHEMRKYRCFKSHWPYRNFRKAKDNQSQSKGKTLYVMRNPHDVMISHWNQVWGMGYHYGTTDWPFEGPEGWGRFADEWLAGNVENGSWFEHVAGWYQRSKEEDGNVLLIRYEELKADLDGSVRRIAAFLGVEAGVEDLQRVRTKTEFSFMKAADEADPALALVRWLGVIRKGHIRQGGGSSHSRGREFELSPAQRQKMEEGYEKWLKPLGMPKEWVFGG